MISKIALRNSACCIALVVQLPIAAAARYATQDLMIFSGVRLNTESGVLDLMDTILAKAESGAGESIALGGGVFFTATSALPGLAADASLVKLGNTTVQAGILSYGNVRLFSALTSSDLDIKRETLGQSDYVQFDITSLLPASVKPGATGRMDYSMMQLAAPEDPASEALLNPLQVAASRAAAGLIQAPTMDGVDPAQVFNLPFTIAEGTSNARYFGKGLHAVGSAIGGGLAGAAVGSVVPGIGTLWGGVAGAVGGGLVSIGDSILDNTEDDDTPDPPPPGDLTPPSTPAVPEPSTYLLLAVGIAAVTRYARNRHCMRSNRPATAM